MIVLPRRWPDYVYPRRSLPPVPLATMGIQGFVKSVELIDVASGIIVRRLGPFGNLITDAGLDALGSDGSPFLEHLVNYIAVGTGSAAPNVADTTLDAETGVRTVFNGGFSNAEASGPSYDYWEMTITRVFLEDESNGNLTEFGFFTAASAGSMWCRQLFLDEGTPTTIVKTDAQQLRITYAYRVYMDKTEGTDTFDIDGISTDCVARAMRISDSESWGEDGALRVFGAWGTGASAYAAFETDVFPALTGGNFAGSSSEASSASWLSYGTGNFYRDVDVVFEPGLANFGTGIGAVQLGPWGNFRLPFGTTFTPKVQKDNTERFTYRARVAWARI